MAGLSPGFFLIMTNLGTNLSRKDNSLTRNNSQGLDKELKLDYMKLLDTLVMESLAEKL